MAKAHPAAAHWMDLRSAIYGRRAVRRYEDRSVEHSKIEAILHAAIQAPSAMNRQPWAFVVIEGRERLKKLSDSAKKHLLSSAGSKLPVERDILTDPAVNIFHDAPALIVVCANTEDTQAAEDCCLAAQNLMLAAYASELATCPIGLARHWLSLATTKRKLAIPHELVPVFPVVLGYPAEEPEKSHGRHIPRILWL
jgi:nitroreductase